jgi:hypothetical protein
MTVPGETVSGSSPGAGPGPALTSTASTLGGFRWIDRRLFEVVGGWVPTVAEPATKRWLAAVARHHAWRADQWAARFPVVRELDLAAATRPPPGWAEALDLLAATDRGAVAWSAATSAATDRGVVVGSAATSAATRAGGGSVATDATADAGGGAVSADAGGRVPVGGGAVPVTPGRLAGLVRVVLPRLVVLHDGWVAVLSPVADGALLRTLRMVVADEVDDWRAGERVLQAVLAGGSELVLAADFQCRIEGLLVAGGAAGV